MCSFACACVARVAWFCLLLLVSLFGVRVCVYLNVLFGLFMFMLVCPTSVMCLFVLFV